MEKLEISRKELLRSKNIDSNQSPLALKNLTIKMLDQKHKGTKVYFIYTGYKEKYFVLTIRKVNFNLDIRNLEVICSMYQLKKENFK